MQVPSPLAGERTKHGTSNDRGEGQREMKRNHVSPRNQPLTPTLSRKGRGGNADIQEK